MSNTTQKIVNEIAAATVVEGDAIFYASGEWTIGQDGCQPNNSICLVAAEGAGGGCQVSELSQWDADAAAEAIDAYNVA